MYKFELTEEQYNEVLHIARTYHLQARRCMDSKAYLAGCIMIGADLEACLLAFANCYPDEAFTSKVAPIRGSTVKPLANWSLAELLAVAKQEDWLPARLALNEEWDRKKAHIGDYAEALRHTRNLVHPIRYLLDSPHKRITKRNLEAVFEIFEVAYDHLLYKINKSLRIALKLDSKA